MNDDATTPELELASAYLDGDVSESERAQVEASPELMELVASFEAVRTQLRTAPPPSAAAAVDDAVAAALAEFDVAAATGTEVAATAALADVSAPSAPSNVVPMRRNRWTKVVMSAAAALLIGGVAVTAINSFGGSSNDSSSAGEPAAEKAADAGDASGGGAPQTISAINGAASPVPVLDEPSDLQAFAATGASETTAAADAVVAGATETTAAAAETATTLASAETVGDAAPQSVAPAAAPTSRLVVLSFPFDCPLEPTQVVVQEISWQGTPAAVVRDTVTGVIQAVDGECNVLASIQP